MLRHLCAGVIALACLVVPARAQEPTQCLSPDLLIQVFTDNGGTVRVLQREAKAKAAALFASIPPADEPRDWSWVMYVTFDVKTPAMIIVGEGQCMAGRAPIPVPARPAVERELFGEGA